MKAIKSMQVKSNNNINTFFGAVFLALLSLMFNPNVALAEGTEVQNASAKTEQIIVNSVARTYQASLEMKQTTVSIISFMLEKSPNEKDHVSVKVPAHVYAGVLQEMQDRNVKFLPSDADIPASARAVFKLKAEGTGLEQTVCLY